jgi:sugar diacid utilization regulator
MEFLVYFKTAAPLHCVIDQTDLGQQYFSLLKQQWQQHQTAIFRDPQRYTLEYFQTLVVRAKNELGWDWHREQYTINQTVVLHKDIEQYLAQGFENIPEQYDELLHELHFALHAIESGSRRDNWLQIEWFDDNGFKLLEDQYPAKFQLEFGDLRLQNPYVGHHPLYVYEQNDYHNIVQTCRMHDFVKPGINLVIQPTRQPSREFDWNQYITWFRKHAPNWLDQIGEHVLKQYTGHPIVGRVINLDDLRQAIKLPHLEFDRLEF